MFGALSLYVTMLLCNKSDNIGKPVYFPCGGATFVRKDVFFFLSFFLIISLHNT